MYIHQSAAASIGGFTIHLTVIVVGIIIPPMPRRRVLKFILHGLLFFFVSQYMIGPSTLPLDDSIANIRAFTRPVEFNFTSWTLDALEVKISQTSLNVVDYLEREAQRQIVLDYLALVERIQTAEAHLNEIYANPTVINVEVSTALVRNQLNTLYAQRAQLGPLAESVLQNMLAIITTEMGFNPGGQPLPPVLYHSTPLPWALIVSPRDVIQQDANVSLKTELTVEEHIVLEDDIAAALDVSTLVVPVGGIGTYPTMVAQSTNLVWIAEVISHEWIHNYLTLRPMGAMYSRTPELRTMNETTASIAGTEIGNALIVEFFPEFAPPPPPPKDDTPEDTLPPPPPDPQAFDFREEMHETRVTVDGLLAEKKIEEAEAYMEERRQFFWENGYRIRKLNQAYFAFYGAYADMPGGAAGEDPVGAAVRGLRGKSATLADFVKQMSWLTSYEDLLELFEETSAPNSHLFPGKISLF